MNTRFPSTIPLIPLALVWIVYALLGWYLSAHHIVWLVGAFIVVVVIAVIGKSVAWLEALARIGSQTLIVVLFLSSSIALIAVWSMLLSLVLLPLTTTILANLELRSSGFTKVDAFIVLTILAGLGLAAGEITDIIFLPSARY